MPHIQAPAECTSWEPSVFLAGGISGCEDWQMEMARLLATTGLAVLNPRQATYLEGAANAERQIRWERRHLDGASMRLFWFPSATLCPIALFELGASLAVSKPLFVGTDPHYSRRFDVVVQLSLVRPEVRVVDRLEGLAKQVVDHCHEIKASKESA